MIIEEQAIWNAYNLLLGGSDTERLRKMLVRYDLFRMSIDLPGDIVECGVFKGTGLMFWLKLLHIYSHGSFKKVVGFDMFSSYGSTLDAFEAQHVEDFIAEASFEGITPDTLYEAVAAAGVGRERCELVAGDIRETAAAYVAARPGFRISLLNMDLDLAEPTLAALEALWPRVVPGGVVVFDEYSVARWTESKAVDQFFEDKPEALKTLPWSRTPTAYLVKR